MKTETEIAKENIERYKVADTTLPEIYSKKHKQTCQRWLEFLSYLVFKIKDSSTNNIMMDRRHKKIEDLQATIKFYEDNLN